VSVIASVTQFSGRKRSTADRGAFRPDSYVTHKAAMSASSSPNSTGRAPRRGRPLAALVPLADALGDAVPQLPDERSDRVRRAVRARTLAVRRGRWDAVADARESGGLGFVVLHGTLLCRVVAGHREGAELLGPGDLIQPGHADSDPVSWRAVTDATLAVVDARVLQEAGAAPELIAGLLTAAASRTNTVARQVVVAQWSSVDDRIVATLEMLADRWGVVTPEGYALPEYLTHALIAPLVGARRPSVTTALKRLGEAGTVRRATDGRWIVARAA
jgi:CRP-like cAMP-binding protein